MTYIPEFPVIGVLADKGWGKTLLMRYLASAYADTGLSVVANFDIFDLEYRKAGMKGAMNHVDDLQNCVLFFDEIYADADAKDYFSKNNAAITNFVAQSRKLHTTFIFSLQLFFTVDKRIRAFTDFFYCPKPYTGPGAKAGDLVVDVFDAKASIGNDHIKSFILSLGKYYPLYNTDERIKINDETWEEIGIKPRPDQPPKKNIKKITKSP